MQKSVVKTGVPTGVPVGHDGNVVSDKLQLNGWRISKVGAQQYSDGLYSIRYLKKVAEMEEDDEEGKREKKAQMRGSCRNLKKKKTIIEQEDEKEEQARPKTRQAGVSRRGDTRQSSTV